MANFEQEVKTLYPFLPDALVDLFIEKYIDFDKMITMIIFFQEIRELTVL